METPPNIKGLRFNKVIGRGGMSVVWLAWHEGMKKDVAVKVLNQEAAQSGLDIRQFMQETRIMTELSHPNIVKGYESDCTNDGRYFFVMEYVDGYTFNDFIEKKTVLPESDALIITQAVADALEYAWQTMKIIHCDIKPDNIMVSSNGDIKLADFGLCEIYSEKPYSSITKEEILGTPAYMSPEQILAPDKLDFRTDIYSLGASLYHLVTKNTLFSSPDNDIILRSHVEDEFQALDPRVYNRKITSGFVHLIEKMLIKNRDARYKSWSYISNDVKELETTGILALPKENAISSIRTLN
jgi:serine/threonine protein kinase